MHPECPEEEWSGPMGYGKLETTGECTSSDDRIVSVSSTGLPKGIEEYTPRVNKLRLGDSPDDPDTMFITSLPIRFDASKNIMDEPDGRTDCLISGYMQAQLVLKHAFKGTPRRVPRSSEPTFRISKVPGKGLGAFAVRDIQAGELIKAERPLVIVPANLTRLMTRSPVGLAHLTRDEIQQVVLCDTEKSCAALVAGMPPDRREAFMKLANSHLHDGSGPIGGRIRTNGFSLGISDHRKSSG